MNILVIKINQSKTIIKDKHFYLSVDLSVVHKGEESFNREGNLVTTGIHGGDATKLNSEIIRRSKQIIHDVVPDIGKLDKILISGHFSSINMSIQDKYENEEKKKKKD